MSLFVNATAKAVTRATLTDLVDQFLASGQTIAVCPTYKGKKPKTFRSSFGAWGRGAKACTLRNSGVAKGRG